MFKQPFDPDHIESDEFKDVCEPKHTPTPWQVTPDEVRIQTLEDAEDYEICDCEASLAYSPDLETCKENAKFIVKCVNSHDALVKLVQEAFTSDYMSAGWDAKAKQALKSAGVI